MAAARAGPVDRAIESAVAWLQGGLPAPGATVTTVHPSQRTEDPPGLNVHCLLVDIAAFHRGVPPGQGDAAQPLLLVSAHGVPAQMLDHALALLAAADADPRFVLRSASLEEWSGIWSMLGCVQRPSLLLQVRAIPAPGLQ